MLEHAGFRDVMALAADMTLGVRPLAGSTHLITGAGSNVVAQVGDDGVLIVDTGYQPALPALRRALGTLDVDRVDRVVVTHPHEDHMGGAAALGAEATVVAHPGTAGAMREPYVFMDGVELPPKPEIALPDVEIARDTTFRFNGEEVRVVPTVAHTAGDLTVYFAGSRVAHFGDTYLGGNPMMFPGQADPDGFLDALDDLLDAMHPETIVVSGHDAPTDLAAVRAQIEASRACMALVRAALDEGLTLEATAERAAGRFAPQWVGFFYRLFSTR
jgi:glyoxylase-like metal-dependent hydrolase (beta-lactamase superfamily II)